MGVGTVGGLGSSPLTRGKRVSDHPSRPDRGLIPAHAGKTPRSAREHPPPGAHPRSRGENPSMMAFTVGAAGSSPLTRGKQESRTRGEVLLGLIPAHAGKTPPCDPCRRPYGAHPRSRGENISRATRSRSMGGSSPLTRGKLLQHERQQGRDRLIPAHAGKTARTGGCAAASGAHPRSRGENSGRRTWTRAPRGLIPAHAGKTMRARRPGRAGGAHPRSRGENCASFTSLPTTAGSSPLTRGKRRW